MADYHLSASVIKRSAGRSATAAAAYRAGEKIKDNRTGLEHDYTRRSGVIHTQIFAPDDAPSWAVDRAKLWNAVEKSETRKDSQLAREIVLGLPHELTQAQRFELTQKFVKEQFVSMGMIADVAFHAPDKDGDQRNYHAHIMLTMRTVSADGFGEKARDWNSRPLLKQWREQWAEYANTALAEAGFDERIDHRSLEDQGIELEPTQHLGWVASELERKGVATIRGDINREIRANNQLIINAENELVELVAQQKTEVTHEHGQQHIKHGQQHINAGKPHSNAENARADSGGIREHTESLYVLQAQRNNAILNAQLQGRFGNGKTGSESDSQHIDSHRSVLFSEVHATDRARRSNVSDLPRYTRLTEALKNVRERVRERLTAQYRAAIERVREAGKSFQGSCARVGRACADASRGSQQLSAGVGLLRASEQCLVRAHRATGEASRGLEQSDQKLEQSSFELERQLEPLQQQCESLDRATGQLFDRINAAIEREDREMEQARNAPAASVKKWRGPGL